MVLLGFRALSRPIGLRVNGVQELKEFGSRDFGI